MKGYYRKLSKTNAIFSYKICHLYLFTTEEHIQKESILSALEVKFLFTESALWISVRDLDIEGYVVDENETVFSPCF
ncbi:hypothetical protein RRG08_046208 [Elysia crispata]|uniref:Uncharacterized protein n=1 Tax=Elysia crispata TaxID=231223 RepID=A0AAE1CJS8_9GAST|nr:hypothetical protein RRG08_046208 [Elysia crispata]